MRQTPTAPADYTLILEWQQGDEKAFDKLYYLYHPHLFRFTFKVTKISTATEEIIHDVFLKIWKNKEKIDPNQSFHAYIFTITRNEICRYLRKQASTAVISARVSDQSSITNSQTEQEILFTDYMQFYHTLLNALPPQKKQIFLLHRQDELSYQEIASQLKLSVKTIEFHMSDCLRWFRQNIRLHTDAIFLLIPLLYLQ